MKELFFVCAGIHVFAPLVFLTHCTQNPYSIQILILQTALLATWGWIGCQLWRSHPRPAVRTVLDLPLTLFCFWALCTWGLSFYYHGPFFRSGIFHEGVRGALFLWVNALGVFLLSTQLARGPQSHVLRQLMLTVGGISAAYGILQYFGRDPLWGTNVNPFSGRPVSTYGNPNFLSSVLVLLLPLLLHEFLSARSSMALWAWGSLGFIYVAALTSTMTRSSWMGAGFALALYGFLNRKTVGENFRRALIWTGGIFLLVLSWPASALGSAVPLSRMADLWRGVTGTTVYAPWHQRLLIGRSAWDMWREHPWIGKGWGLFELFFPYYQGRLIPLDLFRSFRTHANNAHELFLEIGSQTGLIGVGLFVWMVLLTMTAHRKALERISPEEWSLATALLAGVGGMAADNALGNVSLFFAVPGFLFFWVWGQWAGLCSGDLSSLRSTPPRFKRLLSPLLIVFSLLGIHSLFRGFLAEAAFFKGSSPTQNDNDRAKEEYLILSQRWKRFDVHNAFELGNLYSRRARNAQSQGFQEEVRANAEKATDAYTDALHANPSYDELFEGRANVLRLLHREEESEQDLRMALLINPLNKEATLALESRLERKNQTDPRRIELLERAVENFPEDLRFHLLLAQGNERAGKRVDAEKTFEWVLARDLENGEAWAGLQRLATPVPMKLKEGRDLLSAIRQNAQKGEWKEAHARAEFLVESFPHYPLARLMAADTAAQMGDDTSAIQRYREFLQERPDHPDARENLATVLDRQGHTDEARQVRASAPLRPH